MRLIPNATYAVEKADTATNTANSAVTKAEVATTKATDASAKASEATTKADDAVAKATEATTKANLVERNRRGQEVLLIVLSRLRTKQYRCWKCPDFC